MKKGFAPILVLGLVAILVFIAFVTFGPFRSQLQLGQLSLRQQQQESQAAQLPPDGGSTWKKPPCYLWSPPAALSPGYGDLNRDNYVTSADALIVKNIAAGLSFPSPYGQSYWSYEVGDVSDTIKRWSTKSDVNPVDALLIERYAAGIITTFPSCLGQPFGSTIEF